MRKTLKDFYFGNIIPGEGEVATDSNLRKAMVSAEQCESRLKEKLGDAERALLAELIEAQQEMESITALENFILGFRLGVRMMVECMDDNDGDLRNGGG